MSAMIIRSITLMIIPLEQYYRPSRARRLRKAAGVLTRIGRAAAWVSGTCLVLFLVAGMLAVGCAEVGSSQSAAVTVWMLLDMSLVVVTAIAYLVWDRCTEASTRYAARAETLEHDHQSRNAAAERNSSLDARRQAQTLA